MNSPAVSVSVITPCRNESEHIETFLRSLLEQDQEGLEVEFLIAEGRSNDGTRELIQGWVARHPAFQMIDNPEGYVSTGLNRAIKAARGEIIIRMDVHTEYAPNYLVACVQTLLETGADNVGGPARTRHKSYLQAAICLAYHSPFSSGGSRFHNPHYEGEVDTVTYGCWKKSTLEKLGFFDEELVRNQDDELNLRLNRSGGRIWQSPAIRSWYYPRASLTALFRQYAQYGYWKVRVIQKHKIPASLRHLAPGGFLCGLGICGVLGLWNPAFGWLGASLAATYGAANLLTSLMTCRKREHWTFLPVMPMVFAAYHFGYGYGFMRGIIDFLLFKKVRSTAFRQITRSPVMPSRESESAATCPFAPEAQKFEKKGILK